MIYALDTNCLLRWLLRDIPEQYEVVNRVLHDAASQVHVADMTIAEMVWVLQKFYDLDHHKIARLVGFVLAHKKINCNRALFERVLDDFIQSPKSSFVDVCLAHYASMGSAALLTFDKTLTKKLPQYVENPV